MGAWGEGPLQNDSAADWFGDLFDRTGLREQAVAALRAGPDQVRAAAWLVAQLGRVYVWPIDHLDEDRILAASALLRLKACEDWIECWGDQGAIQAALDAEIEALRLSAEQLQQAGGGGGGAGKKATKKKVAKKKAANKKAANKKAANKKAGMGTRGWTRLVYQDETSHEFWAIKVSGWEQIVHYGRGARRGSG
ncbi:MAG: hypothetical protein AB7N76_32065 [Planctomycetota bacterium]